jgi:hypothetical protein
MSRVDPDKFAYPRSLISIHAVRLQTVEVETILEVEKLIANSMDPDQTAWILRLVWIHAGFVMARLIIYVCIYNLLCTTCFECIKFKFYFVP